MTATLPLDGLGPDQSAPVLVDWTPTSPLRGILVMAAIVAVLAFLVVRGRRRAESYEL